MSVPARTAIVTGAGSGIGRAVAARLNRAGWLVTVAGRRPEALAETIERFDEPGNGLAISTDVTDEHSVEALFDRTVERFGRVDLLFNNAGVNVPGVPLDELSVADLRRIVDVNLWGMMLCARSAFAIMKRQDPAGGRIINNGSVSAYGPRPHSAPYTATKHGITGLTKALILDGRAFNIVTSQIDIGNAATEMSAYMQVGTLRADGATAPEPRIDAAHIAAMVLEMASLPAEVNTPFVTIMASAMPLYGRG